MRDVSQSFKQYVLDLENNSVLVWLMTFAYTPAGADASVVKFRFCSHHEVVISQGNTFSPTPMKIRPPQSIGPSRGRATGRLQMEGVSRTLTRWIRIECVSKPTITMEIIMLAQPNAIEYGPIEMSVGDVDLDAKTTTLPLTTDDAFTKSFQTVLFDPARAPALFV